MTNTRSQSIHTFFIVWLGQLVSLIGSNVTGFALGVWVYKNTGSVTQFALISICTMLPYVVISPFAGALVDRWNHRWIMIVGDTGAGLSLLVIAALLYAGKLEVWNVCIAIAISSSFSAFQWPAYNAAVTFLVPKKHLGRAIGMIQMGWAVGQVAAPMLGAWLLNTIDLEGVILFDFISFICAVFVLLCVRFPKQKTATKEKTGKSTIMREIGDGWGYIASRPGLLGLFFFFTAYNFIVGIVEVLFAPLVLSFSSTVSLGIIMSVGGVGMLTGGLVMSIWGGPERRMVAIISFMILCGFCTVIAGMSTSVTLLAVAAFFFFLGLPIVNACTQVILQKKVSLDLQGRVLALRMTLQQASLPLGYVVAGPLADYLFEPWMATNGPLSDSIGEVIGVGPGRGIGLMFVVMGILMMAFTMIGYCFPHIRKVEDELPDAISDQETTNESESVISNDRRNPAQALGEDLS